MKRQKNLQEADDLEKHRGKKVNKTTEMDGADEDQSERCGDEAIQEPDIISYNMRTLDDQDQKAIEDAEDNPKAREYDHDEEAGQREITPKREQESIQEKDEGCKDPNENASDDDSDDSKSDTNSQCVTDPPEMDGADGQRETTHQSVGESVIQQAVPIVNDGLIYLKELKRTFDKEREKYDMFKATMLDFKNFRIDTADCLGRMREILKGHDFLIMGLNLFLPRGYGIPHAYDEDEMFIESALGAYERCFEVNDSIIEGRINVVEGPLQIEQHFEPSHLWCMKRASTDCIFDVVGAIREDPTKALPLIMKRLKRKYEEFRHKSK